MNREELKHLIEFGDYNRFTDYDISRLCKKLCEDSNRQKIICVEELCEFTQEVTRYLRGRGDEIGVREELADAFLVLKCIGHMINPEYGIIDLDNVKYFEKHRDLNRLAVDANATKKKLFENMDFVFCIMSLTWISYDKDPMFDEQTIRIMFDKLINIMYLLRIEYSEIREYINVKANRQYKKLKDGTVI